MKMLTEYGGSFNSGKRKVARPFDPKKPQHVTMRSENAKGEFSLNHPKFKTRVNEMVYVVSVRHNIRIYRFVNAGNHLHFIVFAKEKSAFQNFNRELASKIARMIFPNGGKFWTAVIYSKLISWGRQFENVNNYLIQNELEACGFIPYQSRNGGKKNLTILKCEVPSGPCLKNILLKSQSPLDNASLFKR